MFSSSTQSNNSDENSTNNTNTSTDYDSVTPTNSSHSNQNLATNSFTTPTYPVAARRSLDNEWHMNYFINKRDGLPKVAVPKKDDPKKVGWNVKPKVASRIDTGVNVVKLKLLDATRKAIMEKAKRTFNSSSTQTEHIRTKLMRDVLVDNQSDMVHMVDEQTETDVEYCAVKAKDGTLIVTSTSAVNTDKVNTYDIGCQTAMPRSSVSFKKMLRHKHSIQYDDDEEDFEDSYEDFYARKSIEEIERKFSRDIPNPISKKPSKNQPVKSISIVVEDENSNSILEHPKEDSESDYADSIQGDSLQPDVIRTNVQKNQNKESDTTFNSWQDLEFPDTKPELPRTYFSDGPTPWSNFKDLVLGNRFLNARLSPIPVRERRPGKKEVTWSDTQVKVVSELMSEANALMEMFDQVAMLLGPDVKLHNVSDVEEFVMPPSTYKEQLNQTCGRIEENLQRVEKLHNSHRSYVEVLPIGGEALPTK